MYSIGIFLSGIALIGLFHIFCGNIPVSYETANILDRDFIDSVSSFWRSCKSIKIGNVFQAIGISLFLLFLLCCFLSLPYWAMIAFALLVCLV